jgi:IS30 family transposase
MAQLTMEEREVVSQMRFAKHTQAEIARRLGRHRCTISRELARNGGVDGYSAVAAQAKAAARRRDRPLVRRMDRPEVNASVRSGLAQYWSPDQIAGRCRIEFPKEPQRWVSPPTIYRWIRAQGEDRPHWEQFLRFGGRRPKTDRRGQIPERVAIAERPDVVNRRRRFGDWEGDTVVGRRHQGGLITLVERKSGFLLAAKVKDRQATRVRRKIVDKLGNLPPSLRRTMTFDNGKEFSEHERLAQELGCKVYFARPYCSWQRGTNENTNGLVRQFFPKKTDFDEISHWQVAQTVDLLNSRPRQRLDYRTPQEVLAKACPVAFEI